VRQHLLAMGNFPRRQVRLRRLEGQRALRPRFTPGANTLRTGLETLEADGLTGTDVVVVLHGLLQNGSRLAALGSCIAVRVDCGVGLIEQAARLDLSLMAPVREDGVLVGPVQPLGGGGQPEAPGRCRTCRFAPLERSRQCSLDHRSHRIPLRASRSPVLV
jgi:hypothetical protein